MVADRVTLLLIAVVAVIIARNPDSSVFNIVSFAWAGSVSYTHLDVYKRQAALGSLKGPKHGGANIKVIQMFQDMKKEVRDWEDEEEVRAYLKHLLHKEAFDRRGLIYGMGHAIYSVSDPRAEVLKGFVESLAKEKGRMKDYRLYSMVEWMAPVSYTHLDNT